MWKGMTFFLKMNAPSQIRALVIQKKEEEKKKEQPDYETDDWNVDVHFIKSTRSVKSVCVCSFRQMGRTEKLVLSIITAVVLTIAVGLEIAGSFVPVWTSPLNGTDGNISYSLWTRQECWDVVCRTSYLRVKWTTHECVEEPNGDETCTTTTGYKLKPDTKCFVADYCNTTWNHNEGKLYYILYI